MNDKKNLIKNVLSLGIVQIANYLLPFISIPIIVRIIGPANYGTINYYSSFIAYFVLLINYGFDYSGTRFIAVEKDDIAKINAHFTKILLAKTLLFVVSLAVFLSVILYVAKSGTEMRVAFYSFLITISWVLSINWFYQGMQQLTKVALFNFISKLVYTVLILLIITQKSNYVWQPLVLSLTQIFISAISFFYGVRKFKIKLVRVNLRSVLNVLWTDKMIFFTILATNLYTDTNIVILGFYESKEHVGYFTAAWKFILIFLIIVSYPISQALFPFLAESFSKGVERGLSIVKRMLPLVIYFTLILSGMMCLMAHFIIIGFYGKLFEPSVLIFRILTLVPVLSYINTILGLQVMVTLKMDRILFRIVLSSGIFSVLFNLLVIRFYGYVGCAFSWVIAEFIIGCISYYYLTLKGINVLDIRLFNPVSVFNEIKNIVKKKQKAV